MEDRAEVSSSYERLIALLDEGGADYQIIEHPPEGRTAVVSPMRGHETREAAKCILLLVKDRKSEFVLAVVPGDARVNIEAVKQMKRATFARFAEQHVAERLSGCVAGTILPVSLDGNFDVIVDPAVAASETMYFNAARLDVSVALKTSDYLRIFKPTIGSVAVQPRPA